MIFPLDHSCCFLKKGVLCSRKDKSLPLCLYDRYKWPGMYVIQS